MECPLKILSRGWKKLGEYKQEIVVLSILTRSSFWDVRQLILRLPVGGSSAYGKLLRDILFYQIELENEIPRGEDFPFPGLVQKAFIQPDN